MIKKTLAIAMSAIIGCQAPVYADYLKKAEFTSDLKISIEGSAPDEKVSVLITPSGADISKLSTAANPVEFFETADYYREITAESDGSFKLEVLFDDKEKGYRDIRISAGGIAEKYEKAVYVVKESDITGFIGELNGKKIYDEAFCTYILDNLPIISEEESVYASDETLREAVASYLLSVRDFMYNGKFVTTSDIKSAFNMAQLISLVNKSDKEADIDKHISDYRLSSELGKACFMEYYDDCKSAALEALKSEKNLSAESFYNLMGEELILEKVKTVSNHNEITEILNDNNSFLKLELKKYNALSDKSAINKAVMKKTSSMAEFKESFESLAEKASENTGKKPSGSSSGGSGGGGGSFGNVSFNEEVKAPTATKEYFADLQGYDWAKESINSLAELGFVNGVGNGSFAPSLYVKREEFVKMTVEAFSSVDKTAVCPFDDVSSADWCAPYVATAFKSGLVCGVSENTFGKGSSVTRQDAALVLSRMLAKSPSVKAEFTDIANVSDYALDAVNLMYELKVINGNEKGEFLPHSPLTRAECAKIIYSLYKLKGEVK